MQAAVLLRLLLVAFAAVLTSSAHAAPDASVYGDDPAFEGIQISHNGQRIAHTTTHNDQHMAVIQDLGSGASCGFATDKLKIRELIWAPQDRLLIRLSPSRRDIDHLISIDASCKDPKLLFATGAGGGLSLVAWAPDGKRLLSTAFRMLPGATPMPNQSLLGWKGFRHRIDFALDVVAVDPATGAVELVEKGNEDTVDWRTDAEGNLRLRTDETRDNQIRVFARIGASTDWKQVYVASNARGANPIHFVGMGPKPDTAYVVTRNGGDRREAYEFDLRTGTLGPVVFRHPQYDIVGYQVDGYTGVAVGVSYTDDLQRIFYFDPALTGILTKLRALLPGEQINIESWARDRSSLILRADGPANPTGSYFLADIVAGAVSRLSARYPSIPASDIATPQSLRYPSRDGLTIPAYLTLPPRSTGKMLPLVVMPHGGPEQRDSANFDNWTQFLATRGYAVFQPQFRGSDGYGWSFKQAGRLQWGLRMQDDITDGVKKLIADGTADPARVCIFGWSYGGYAALAGLAFTPDLYKCGIAGAGVSDLRGILGHVKNQAGSWYALDYWPDVIGDPFHDVDRLEATSPAEHAAKIKAPLLLLHSKNDTVVPHMQSEIMARAMRKAGKPHEFITLEGDDHWLSHAETEKRVLREVERFLSIHLK